VFRVLKPGGHVLAFYGTRTYDWGVMAMRFAGFEVRDCIQWLYGSGFPKSHNISKALDKMGGESLDWFIEYILELAKERNISKKELTMLFPSKNGNPTGWLWNKQNNQSITLEQYNTIKEYLKLPFENIEEAKREVIGRGKAGLTKGDIANFSGETEFDITAPSTDSAKQWDGWGSALKPANEPIVLARKPLEKGLSIAENILKWGVGGINIDASRIGNENRTYKGMSKNTPDLAGTFRDDNWQPKDIEVNVSGRFPANIILTHHEDCECKGTKKVKANFGNREYKVGEDIDNTIYGKGYKREDAKLTQDENGMEEVENWDCHEDCPIRILDEQSGVSKSSNTKRNRNTLGSFGMPNDETPEYNDKGGASRFFYVAKASKSERNKGLDGFEEKIKPDNYIMPKLTCSECGSKRIDSSNRLVCGCNGKTHYEEQNSIESKNNLSGGNKNHHPTVKPIKLMQYLVKMITPPNGIVLDPFCGSGTTGVACKLDGFQFVGLEQDPEYFRIAEARINNTNVEIESQLKLF
jgi:DNA modification methylase